MAHQLLNDPLLSFAQVALGDLAIGVDTRYVVRAVARPPVLTRLPRSHGAVDGVFADGGQAVPVVDLRKWMGEAAGAQSAGTPGQVLIVGAEGRLVGLAIDAVRGLVRARSSQLQRIHHSAAEDDFFHSVAPGGNGTLLSLLDPLHLMARVQAWTADSAQAEAGVDRGMADGTAAAPAQALVRLGDILLAVPAALVAQVLERPAAQPLLGSVPELLGMIDWRARHVPLLDLAHLLGLERCAAPLAMVLAQGESLVALPIDGVAAVQPLPARELTPAAEAGIAHPLVSGVALLGNEERVLLLDGEALLRTHAVPGLARQADAAQRARRAPAHIVIDAGRSWAIPMSALEEILPLPAGLDTAHPDGAIAPTHAWRGRTLPVFDLREAKEHGDETRGPQRLIVVREAGRHAALRVNDVVELLPALAGELLEFRLAGGARTRMITVGRGAGRASYPVLGLDALPCFAGA